MVVPLGNQAGQKALAGVFFKQVGFAPSVAGFDPKAPLGTIPFLRAENHLALAHKWGLDTNVLGEIGI